MMTLTLTEPWREGTPGSHRTPTKTKWGCHSPGVRKAAKIPSILNFTGKSSGRMMKSGFILRRVPTARIVAQADSPILIYFRTLSSFLLTNIGFPNPSRSSAVNTSCEDRECRVHSLKIIVSRI